MIRGVFCVLTVAVWTSILFPVCLLAMVVTFDTSSSLWVVRKLWAPVLLWAGGAEMIIEGVEHVDLTRPCIFVSNHQSTIDIPVLFAAIPVNFRFVAKQSLKYVPVLGWYLSLAKFIFVDRGNRKRAIKSLEVAAERIHGGVSILMFPEGTRSETGRMMPFKKGPFALALQAKVPIVPVALEGTGALMPKNSWRITPGPVRVRIGTALDVTRFGEDRDALLEAVQRAVEAQHRAIGGQAPETGQAAQAV